MPAKQLNGWSPVELWKNTVPRESNLKLTEPYMNLIGVTRDERLMAVVFGHYESIASKVIHHEFMYKEKKRLEYFFSHNLDVVFDGNCLVFVEVS